MVMVVEVHASCRVNWLFYKVGLRFGELENWVGKKHLVPSPRGPRAAGGRLGRFD